jgi:hypothetical protein
MFRLIRLLAIAALLLPMAAFAQREITGTTPSGASYRIAVPDTWKNGDALILFQHGLTFAESDPDPSLGPIADLQLSEGYALAASSYRQRAWALFTAADDNAELLEVFRAQVGTPGAIIPYGASLGGLIALKLAEDPRFAPVPGVYSACAPAAGSRVWDTAIDLRLAYDVVCSGAGELPTGDAPYPWAYNLSDIPNNLSDLFDQAQLLQTLLPLNQCTGVNLPAELRNDAMKRRLAQLMNLAHITDEKFFVTNVGYATYALSDLVRAPDKLDDLSPFSTLGVDYNDAAINAGIARISGDPFAQLYFRWASDFRGRIAASTKVLAIQTSQDQLVIPANQYVLRQTLPAAQLTSALVNESKPSHCGFTLAEGVAGWEALRGWIATSSQPSVSTLQTDCAAAMNAGAAGPCRYDANVAVPTFDSQVRPREAVATPVIDGRFTGQWFDPARNGEGIALEVLPANKALVYFFTYPEAGAPGQQTWLTAVGDIIDGGIEFADVQLPSLDANGQLHGTHWGRIGLTFTDCNNGAMRWDGPPGWGSLEVPLTRLTLLEGFDCGVPREIPIAAVDVSGAWFDPAHYGSGFTFEQLDAATIASIWFGFDAQREPIWMTGVLHRGVDVPTFIGTFAQGLGPQFGAGYDPAAFHFGAEGTLNAAFQCTSASTDFIPTQGEALIPPTLALQRITTPLGVAACTQ